MDSAEWSGDSDDIIDVVDRLDSVLASLCGELIGGFDREALRDRSARLHQARQRLDAAIAVTVTEADVAGVPLLTRQRTMSQVLGADVLACPDAVRADLRVGRFLRDLPVLEQGVLDGAVSRDHAQHLQRGVNHRVQAAAARDQELFISWATTFEWTEFKQAFAYWLEVNDQDGAEPEEQDPKNTFNMRRHADGRVRGNFDLDPVSGEVLMQQIGDEDNALFAEDNECSHARTSAQRRAQAFTNLITRGAGRTATSQRPLIHVVMSMKVLMHTIAQLDKDEHDQDWLSPIDPNSVDGRCELIDGTPIHPKYALVLAMQANLRRQVLTAKNVTLEASHTTRAFPTWMKHVRLVETRGACSTAGCDANHTWLQADHRVPYSKTGTSRLGDLDLLCGPDNRHKHTGPQLRQRRGHNTDIDPTNNDPDDTTP